MVSLKLYNRAATVVFFAILLFPALTVWAQAQQKTDSVATQNPIASAYKDTVPKPKSVMIKSAIIPGWGQIVNHQIWKVPIIYAGLAGLSAYGVYLTKLYHEYRAAYYNSLANSSTGYHNDQRYGPTVPSLAAQSQNALKYYRNYYRNRRDMAFLGVGLVYGLNIVDAYVFAQLRDFDVSNNLSMSTAITPITNRAYQGVAISFTFHLKNGR